MGLVGGITAIVLALYCYQATVNDHGAPSALWLALFTFAMSTYVLDHALLT